MQEYRLAGLSPRWLGFSGRKGMGISFQCPCCVGTAQSTRLAVWFKNPVDGKETFNELGSEVKNKFLWQRIGDTFATLKLTPSIDASDSEPMHWHGTIVDGCMVGGKQNKGDTSGRVNRVNSSAAIAPVQAEREASSPVVSL